MRIRIATASGRNSMNLPLEDSDLLSVLIQSYVDWRTPICKLVGVEDPNNPLKALEGTTVNLDEVNFFAKRMDGASNYEKSVMTTFAERHGIENVKDLINLTYSMQGVSLITDFAGTHQVGQRLYLDKNLGMSETEKLNTDFIAYAEQILKEAKVEVTPYGVLVENGFEMQEVYNGRTFPMFISNPDETVAIVTLQNMEGAEEYLYLPTSAISLAKVKQRLGVAEYGQAKITGIENCHLPDSLVPDVEKLRTIEELTFFNELCENTKHFNADQMQQLEMAVAFVGADDFTDQTFVSRNLGAFEIHTGVHNEEEYGKYLVKESGLFDVNELLWPHIDYVAFAKDTIQGTMNESRFLSGGFVGMNLEFHDLLQYNGEFADPLEVNESLYHTFCLYSPLTAQLYKDGEDQGNLYRLDLTEYEEEISEAIERDGCREEVRGLMHYYDGNQELAAKVLSAYPKVQNINGELYGVMECKIKEELTEQEVERLKSYLEGQMSDGWGEGFEQREMRTDAGDLLVSFWSSENYWSIQTAEELGIEPEEEMTISIL